MSARKMRTWSGLAALAVLLLLAIGISADGTLAGAPPTVPGRPVGTAAQSKFDELFVSPSGHWFDFDGSRKRSVLPEL